MKFSIVLPIISILLFVGCSSKDPKIDIKEKPKLQVPKVSTPIKKKKGSLYTRRGPSLFSDKKDLQIGDIIQVVIDESLTNTSKNTLDSSKTSSTGINGGIVTAPDSGNLANRVNQFTNIGLKAGSSSSFKGAVSAKADEQFTTTISAVIVQTYQNGNYFIEGSKEMLINGQKQVIKISGLIRPYDITPENSIYSSQLANLKVLYDKKGEEMDTIKKPWGSRAIESIWPF
jgi:flagellar L-ring protein precursor FlgH